MLVVVHDFSPVFIGALNAIMDALLPLVGRQLSLGVVPRWHGNVSQSTGRNYRDLLHAVDERLLHGWTHYSQNWFGPISLLTGRADEFRGLASPLIHDRIRSGQMEFAELTGKPAEGLLPPAWQLPLRSTELETLRFVMRFRSLECCCDPGRNRPLVTWSWDWGSVGCLSRGGELLGRWFSRTDPAAIPCVAVHPADVRRGCLSHAVRLIRQLIDSGHEPTTARQLISGVAEIP